jgi:hypothetical protein
LRKTAPVSLVSSKYLETLSTRQVSCSTVLCLGLNPNCSSRSNPCPLTSWRILDSRLWFRTFLYTGPPLAHPLCHTLVSIVGVSVVIGQNKLFCTWSE